MFQKFVKKRKEPEGYISLLNLKDWWHDSFTKEEQKHIVETFQPLGASKDVLVTGVLQSTGYDNPLSFLTSLAGWFNNSQDRLLAHKIISKAEEYIASERNILNLHFFYSTKMKLFYKERKNPEALLEAVNACLRQIEIADKAATAFHKELGNNELPLHEGYEQLCIIKEKQMKFEDTIKLAQQAKKQGWGGDWDSRIERCRKKIKSIISKT